MKGLEISIVSLKKTTGGTSTRRFDPEYFQKQHLADESLAQSRPRDFQSFADLDLTVDGSAFYPAIEDYYGTGELPFIRVADVDAVIDFENCTRIPAELCDKFPTLCRIYPGDLVFTKGGSVARIGLVTQEAAASRDLIFLNTSKLSQAERTFLYVYSQTAFFNRMLLRSSSQTAQPHLTITLVRNLPALRAGNRFKEKCVEVVEQAFAAREKAIAKMNETEATLTAALGLGNWQPPEPLTYTSRASEAFAIGRLDAEYFQPKYQALLARAREHAARTRLVQEFAVHCDRGEQPEYFDDGTLAVVTSKHILETGLDYGNFDRTRDSYWTNREFVAARIFKNDILTYTTGAKVGRTAVYLNDERALASNHVNVLRLREENPIYVAVVMNSLIGRWQTRMIATGSAQVELYPNDIKSFVIPFVDTATESAIVSAVRSAHTARARARELLERAKRAVEIAIEQDEKAALESLEK